MSKYYTLTESPVGLDALHDMQVDAFAGVVAYGNEFITAIGKNECHIEEAMYSVAHAQQQIEYGADLLNTIRAESQADFNTGRKTIIQMNVDLHQAISRFDGKCKVTRR